MQCKKIVDYVGSFYAYMGGMDALVFTAGIGEKSPQTRADVCARLQEAFGVEIDLEKNEIKGELMEISTPNSKVKVLVVPTNEELMIARDTMRLGNIK
jgi:acetate kinase